MDRLLLMLPGPMQVPQAVSEAARRPLFFHRSPRFHQFQNELKTRLRPVFGTQSADIVFLSSCGTGAMESAVVNLTSPGDEILIMVGGAFAQRWVEIGTAFGLNARPIDVDWRHGATLPDVTGAMDRFPDAEIVFLTWSESSTGVLLELEAIGNAVRNRRKFLVVDAVSGLGVSPLEMDAWCIDTVVSGSQKGLMMPPGLGVVSIGERALERAATSTSPRFTWNWKPYLEQVPVTPPLSLMHQLSAALDLIESQGLDGLYRRRRQVAETIRRLVSELGLKIYAERPGDGITAVCAPAGLDIERFRVRLEREYSVLIAGAPGPLQGQVFRIGHVGHLTDQELDYFCDSFRKALQSEWNGE